MAVHVAVERLLAVVDHLHRATGVQGQQGQVDLQADVLTGTEGAAHPGQLDAHLLGRQAEAGAHLGQVVVQPLGAHEQVDPAIGGGDGQPGLGAQRGLVLHAHVVGALDGDRSRPAGLQVAVADDQVPEHVAVGVDGGGVGRGQGVDQRRQLLVGDPDGGRRPAGGLGMVGGHHHHRLTHVAHDLASQHRLIGRLQPVGGRPRHVVGGQHGVHAADAQGRPDVDPGDPGVGVGRAQGVTPQHALGE